MKQKQLITAMLSLCMVTNMCGTVFADNVTYEEKRGTPVTISLENGEDLTADEFVVKVPKKVRASKEQAVPYTVTVSGKLKEDRVLHVVPNEVVKLTSGDSDIVLESKVTQDKTDFDSEELEVYDEVVADGSVGTVGRVDGGDIDEVKGSYSGNMIFSISVDDGETVVVKDPDESAGLCDADGQISKTWKEMSNDGDVVVTDGKLTSVSSNVSGNIVIPTSVTSIGDAAFYNVRNTISVIIPDSVTEIASNAFQNPYGFIVDVTIPDSVSNIDKNTFAYVKHITYSKAKYNDTYGAYTVNGYKDGDFYYSNNAKTGIMAYVGTDESVSIPDTVQSIGEYAFKWCRNTTSITIPSSVTVIDQQAFYQCGVKSLAVPSSVTYIGEMAFYGIDNVTYDGTASGSPWGGGQH